MNVLVVVPVRLESTRFPNKPLYKIKGREMVLRVLDNLPSFKKIGDTQPTDCGGSDPSRL
jgi:CMP-2-keto-3-deoxyoctulosonic acid synthetase